MKKLIVLYGPENSGKTTTLKMVYENLKTINTKDKHWFKYYDRDNKLLDFRDILFLDKTKISSILSPLSSLVDSSEFEIGKISDIVKVLKYLFGIYEITEIDSELQKLEKQFQQDGGGFTSQSTQLLVKGEQESKKKEEDDSRTTFLKTKIKQIIDNLDLNSIQDVENMIKKFEDINDEVFPKSRDNEPKEGEDYTTITDHKVGLILEGDYGFVHTTAGRRKHKRNLFKHLMQLINCDTIVCACSVFPATIIQQPLLCLFSFLLYYILKYKPLSINVHLVYSKKNKTYEEDAAKLITNLI